MASKSASSYGTRLSNAERIWAQIASYPDYAPASPELTAVAYRALIDQIKSHNTEVAARTSDHTTAVSFRSKLFFDKTSGLHAIVSAISADIDSNLTHFGKKSKESAVIRAMANKIRGENTKRKTKEPEDTYISRVESGYGNMTKVFSDMITTLEKYDDKYNRPGNDLNTDKLKIKLEELNQSSQAVAFAYVALKPQTDIRSAAYDNLSIVTQGIKNAVKRKYTPGLPNTFY